VAGHYGWRSCPIRTATARIGAIRLVGLKCRHFVGERLGGFEAVNGTNEGGANCLQTGHTRRLQVHERLMGLFIESDRHRV